MTAIRIHDLLKIFIGSYWFADLDVKGWGWSCGEHQVPLTEYIRNLNEIVDVLEATGAQLLWATTTPAPEPHTRKQGKPPNPKWPINPIQYQSKDVITYNAAATKIMRSRGVPLNDLYTFVLPRMSELQNPADVHFTADGSVLLGARVAAVIKDKLKERQTSKL